MQELLIVVLSITVLVNALALARVQRALTAAEEEIGEDRRGRSVVVLDVRNADDVAASRTKLARALSVVAPSATRALVHRELVRQLREQLAEEGIHADIRVRRLPSPTATTETGSPTASPVAAADDQPGPI